MPFIPENRLEEALVAAVKSPGSAPEFYRLLLESDLLVLGSVEGQDNAGDEFTVEPGGAISLVAGERNGEQFLPIFSSLTRMQEWVTEESKYLSMNGRALLDLTRGAPIILNPGSEYGKELKPHEVEQLLGAIPQPSQPRSIVGEAAFPPGLVDALTSVFERHPEITAAWMIQVTFPDQPPHPLVGIETSADMGVLMAEIEAMAAAILPGLVFDVQRVDRDAPAGMTDALLQSQPFYQRAVPGRILN